MSTRVFTPTHQNLNQIPDQNQNHNLNQNPNLNQSLNRSQNPHLNPNQNLNQNRDQKPKHKRGEISRATVGVYLPNKPYREAWRLERTYARQLRDMNLGRFVNRADDFRLFFTPDPRKMFSPPTPLPGESLGLNQRRLENGISLRPARRTGVRCLRHAEHRPTQCRDNNRSF
jgi:hypothetical protein